MAEQHILAVHTYGSQRVQHPQTHQTVSAYKIGYSSAACETLLALYGTKARDVSSPRASYHYVQIDGDTAVSHSYLLLKVSPDELMQAEAVTRRYHRAAVFLWRESKWLELPNNRDNSYTEPVSQSGPGFNPSGYRPVSPSTGEKETAVEGIRVEKSQRDPNQKPWFWILGDTYPQRLVLKRSGARFSGKRKCWYYVGWELPDGIKRLVTEYATSTPETPPIQIKDDPPCSDEEASAILGIPIKTDASLDNVPPRLFVLGGTVYARHDLETPDSKAVATGTRGTISWLYNINTQHGWSYDVDFDGIGIGWYFERELTALEPIPGIRISRGSVVPPGVALPPTDANIKRTLLEKGQQPVEEAAPELQSDDAGADEPKIRVLKPQSLAIEGAEPDAVQLAIQQAKAAPHSNSPPVMSASNGSKSLVHISQQCVGELSGSISGQVWCYGYAIHEGVCIYLNLGGPRMAVEAIRAKLSKGDIVSVTPWDAPAVELTAGEDNTGMYTAFMQNISEAKFTSLILLHDWVVNPNYGGKSTTFIFRIAAEQAAAQLKHHITELVKVPVFDDWTEYLYQAGQAAMLVRRTRAGGELDLLTLDLDVDAWTRLITGGLEQKVIELPDQQIAATLKQGAL